MRLTILFLILAVVLFLVSRLTGDDEQDDWIETEAAIVSENEGAVNICYYAEAYIDGELQRGVSVYYKKSDVIFSNGDRIRILYHPIKGTFNKFEFKLMDSRLTEVDSMTKPWSRVLMICSFICVIMAAVMFIKR